MFQSEHLQEKWSPLLDYEGLDPIKDSHRRSVTAVLLENQEKFLREEAAFSQGINLMESPTNSAGSNPAGFSGSAAAGGPVAGFDPVLISLIRRAMPNLVAYDLAGVQPMNGPTGLIFAMRSRYENQSGNEALFNEVDTAFSGQDDGFNLEGGFADGAVGLGTTSQTGSNPSVLNPVGTATTNPSPYNVGEGMQTGDAENLGAGTGDQFNQMAFSIEKVTVTAKSRALKAEYSLELAQDLRPSTVLTLKQNLLTSSLLKSLRKSTEKSSEPSTRLLSKALFLTPQLLVSSTWTLTPMVVGLLRSSKDFCSKSRETLTRLLKELVEERATWFCVPQTLLPH